MYLCRPISIAARGITLAGVTLLLAACGQAPVPEDRPRPVLVQQPGVGSDSALLAYAGEVHAREESPLAFRIGGNLVRRLVDAGDTVRAGQVLAELDPGDQQLQAQAAHADVAATEAELARVRGDVERYRRLARDQLVSRSTLDAQEAALKAAVEQARAARAQADVARNQAAYARLVAPRDGVIASREAEAGQVVAAGQTIFTLAGAEGREVSIALPESRIREFAVGQPVSVVLWNAPGEPLAGRIREIAAAADAQTRTYAARVALDGDAARRVALGQSARVYARLGDGSGLHVPLSALQPGADGGDAVWVVDPDEGRVHAVAVTLGIPGESEVPVLSGLSEGDWVVAAGGHLLTEGQAVAPVDRQNRPIRVRPPAQQTSP